MARTPVCDCVRVRVLYVRVRVLGVWPYGLSSPSVSGRMASGFSPRGVASFVHALGWGSGVPGVEWSAIYPGPCPTPVPDL